MFPVASINAFRALCEIKCQAVFALDLGIARVTSAESATCNFVSNLPLYYHSSTTDAWLMQWHKSETTRIPFGHLQWGHLLDARVQSNCPLIYTLPLLPPSLSHPLPALSIIEPTDFHSAKMSPDYFPSSLGLATLVWKGKKWWLQLITRCHYRNPPSSRRSQRMAGYKYHN